MKPKQIVGTMIRAVRRATTKWYLQRAGVTFGKHLDVVSCPFVRRHQDALITLGEGVAIKNTLAENSAGVSHRCVIVAAEPGARLVVGDHVGMSGVVLHCSNEIIIESYVKLGAGVKIYDTDFHPLGWQERRVHDKCHITTAPVRICKDAWVGAGATVLRGVTIGARSIIGAGAVVTRSVPQDSVAVGVPARVVRTWPSRPGSAACAIEDEIPLALLGGQIACHED